MEARSSCGVWRPLPTRNPMPAKRPTYHTLLLAGLALAAPLAALGAAAPASETARATLTVHVDRSGPRVSPQLYGVFFEEINHAGDGGLYAEMVRNRDFQEASGPFPAAWFARAEAGAKASVTLDGDHPSEAMAPKSLRLDVSGPGKCSVLNGGYWGMNVRRGATYQLSFFARRGVGIAPELTVALEGAMGEERARTTVRGLTPRWKRYTVRLTANADDADARLALSPGGSGSVWLSVVSLFPEHTWKRRKNGLRSDLAGMVDELRPAFLRFPGGCFVEGGDHLADAFRWKTTLGDIAARPGHQNAIWGYRSTDGLGFHEYLQFCEDLGAEAMFVVNCGMSHKELVPMAQLGPWVQDALDGLEYALGPATSHWGAVRAKNGHPAPFRLKYVEIGNENGMFGGSFGGSREQYAERYRVFYDAIKARYPAVVAIANTPIPHPMDLVDDHYYNSPAWFWSNIGLYDQRDRRAPKVYVGEYAVTSDCGKGNLKAGLAEAAWLTGLERNSDVIEMASYAPLFVHTRDRKWNPDAIVFDSARSYGTPSYYVQRLYARNRPDVILPMDVTPPATAPATEKGGIGLATWATQAEFRDIEVIRDGKTVYRSDFSSGSAGWKPLRGKWSTVDGALRQSDPTVDRRIVLDAPELKDASDYTLHLKARKLAGEEGFLIMFRTQDEGSYYWWNVGGWSNREDAIEKSVAGSKFSLGAHVPNRVETGRLYDLRIEVQGVRIRCYLDGKLKLDVTDRPAPTLAAVAGRTEKSDEIIVKVVNGAETDLTADIRLDGAAKLESRGKAYVLSGDSMQAENSLEQPEKIAIQQRPVTGVGPQFTYTFPARSVTVLRLKQKLRTP